MNKDTNKISINRKKFSPSPIVDQNHLIQDQATSSVKLREDIHEIVLPNLWFSSRETGSKYRLEVLHNLKIGKVVHINFAQVMGASHSFLDEMYAVLIKYLGQEYILKNVKVINADEDVLSDLATAIEIRSNERFYEVPSSTLESILSQWSLNKNVAYIQVPVDMSKLQDLREMPEPNTGWYEIYALNPCNIATGPEDDAEIITPRHSKMQRVITPAKQMYRYCPLYNDYYHGSDQVLTHRGKPIDGVVVDAQIFKNEEDELFYWKLKLVKYG